MKRLISVKIAGTILLVSLGAMMIFHVMVLLGYVPSDIVWGGRIGDSRTRLLMLEALAFGVTAIFAIIIVARINNINSGKSNRAANIGTWLIFGYLILNTAGNLASTSPFEKLIFTPLTLLLAFCALRLAIEK